MRFLVRNIQRTSINKWLGLGETDAEKAVMNPPLWVIRDFIPTERDEGSLSLFEVSDSKEAEIISGAFAFGRDKLEVGQVFLAVADFDEITADNFSVRSTPGKLNHKLVDTLHRQIDLPDIDSVIRLAKHFLQREAFCFEGKTAGNAARNAARSDQFFYRRFIERGTFDTNWPCRHLLHFIKDEIVSVQGIGSNPLAPRKSR